jgi:two-component system, LuxR family, response regulator FixJ
MKSQAELPQQEPLVIVVDDDRAVRNSLKFSLEIEGFAVRTYCDGNDLLSDTDLGSSTCLVIDHNLPGMSGLDTIRRIFIPAILITSHPSAAVARQAAKAAVPIVEKPLLENALFEQIHAALEGRHG